jgi:hypothetical protein
VTDLALAVWCGGRGNCAQGIGSLSAGRPTDYAPLTRATPQPYVGRERVKWGVS